MRRLAPLLIALCPLALACDPPHAQQPDPTPLRSASAKEVPDPDARSASVSDQAQLPATDARPAPIQPELPTAAGISYVEVVTGGARADAKLPMIIAIHGLGDRPRDFVGLFDGFPAQARIIAPRAIDDHEPGYSWFPIRARTPDTAALSKGMLRAVDALIPAIESLTQSRPTRGKPILTGFSQGGMLTFTIATRHPELIGAAVAVGGWLPDPLWPKDVSPMTPKDQRAPTIFALHGDADPALRIENTRECVDALNTRGYDVRLHEYPGVGHTIPRAMRDELFSLLAEAVEEAPR